MHWILQTDLFSEEGYRILLETLRRFEIPFSIHNVIPFTGKLTRPRAPHLKGPVICMGSYSLRHAAKKHRWFPGVFDLEPFDFTEQLKAWGTHMLNADSVVVRFADAVMPLNSMFIRPIQDSKVFAGKVFEAEDFYDWQTRVCVLNHDHGTSLSNDTLVQVSPIKDIHSEYRFWVVKGRIVTASQYKLGSQVIYSPVVDESLFDYVRERIAEHQPAEAFVIDVCTTPDGMKIVETNTLNSSGFYAADIQKLVMSLEDAFNNV
jgi:hypothetical protein